MTTTVDQQNARTGPLDPVGADLTKTLKALKLGQRTQTLPEGLALARQRQMGHDTRQLVDQCAETWIVTTLASSDRKTSTKSMYAAVARHHIIGSQLGATPIHRVRPSAVDGWLAELRRKGLSDSTRRNAYTILRAIFDAAVEDRELADNPWPRLRARASRSRRRRTSPPSRSSSFSRLPVTPATGCSSSSWSTPASAAARRSRTIDPSRDYQPTGRPPGPAKKN